jgi:hypothetical protein
MSHSVRVVLKTNGAHGYTIDNGTFQLDSKHRLPVLQIEKQFNVKDLVWIDCDVPLSAASDGFSDVAFDIYVGKSLELACTPVGPRNEKKVDWEPPKPVLVPAPHVPFTVDHDAQLAANPNSAAAHEEDRLMKSLNRIKTGAAKADAAKTPTTGTQNQKSSEKAVASGPVVGKGAAAATDTKKSTPTPTPAPTPTPTPTPAPAPTPVVEVPSSGGAKSALALEEERLMRSMNKKSGVGAALASKAPVARPAAAAAKPAPAPTAAPKAAPAPVAKVAPAPASPAPATSVHTPAVVATVDDEHQRKIAADIAAAEEARLEKSLFGKGAENRRSNTLKGKKTAPADASASVTVTQSAPVVQPANSHADSGEATAIHKAAAVLFTGPHGDGQVDAAIKAVKEHAESLELDAFVASLGQLFAAASAAQSVKLRNAVEPAQQVAVNGSRFTADPDNDDAMQSYGVAVEKLSTALVL